MCRSAAEGGQRCPGHAKTALGSATSAYRSAIESSDPAAIDKATQRLDKARVDYASTPEGEADFRGLAQRAAHAQNPEKQAAYDHVIAKGLALRERNAAVLDANRAAQRARQTVNPDTNTKVGRMIHSALHGTTNEERQYAVASLPPVDRWSPQDRLAVASNLRDMPVSAQTKEHYHHQIREHVTHVSPEERAAVMPHLKKFYDDARTVDGPNPLARTAKSIAPSAPRPTEAAGLKSHARLMQQRLTRLQQEHAAAVTQGDTAKASSLQSSIARTGQLFTEAKDKYHEAAAAERATERARLMPWEASA